MTEKPYVVLSLGAGVQSSTLALMAAHGDLPMPDVAIFADTHAEPASVYAWLERLERELPYPVIRVSGGDIMADQTTMSVSKDGTKYLRNLIPAFSLNPDGSQGMLLRKCTADYKLAPIRRKVRELAAGRHVHQWIGISRDEAHRMKDSGVRYITNIFPLIERGMLRVNCLDWLQAHGYPVPPKSACIVCPYHSDAQWQSLSPDELGRAVSFEKKWNEVASQDQSASQIRGVIRLHRSLEPLDRADFSTAKDHGQLDLFGNECEGMCGV